jgi:hypothetical protein
MDELLFAPPIAFVADISNPPKMSESYEYVFRAPFEAINAAVFYKIEIAAMQDQLRMTHFETHGVVDYAVSRDATGDRARILVLSLGDGVTAIDCQPTEGDGLRAWFHAIVAQVASYTGARCIQIAHIRRFL